MAGSEHGNGCSATGAESQEETFDAILIVGFGGPEKPEDVLPFFET